MQYYFIDGIDWTLFQRISKNINTELILGRYFTVYLLYLFVYGYFLFVCLGFYTFNSYVMVIIIVSMTGQKIQVPQRHSKIEVKGMESEPPHLL